MVLGRIFIKLAGEATRLERLHRLLFWLIYSLLLLFGRLAVGCLKHQLLGLEDLGTDLRPRYSCCWSTGFFVFHFDLCDVNRYQRILLLCGALDRLFDDPVVVIQISLRQILT